MGTDIDRSCQIGTVRWAPEIWDALLGLEPPSCEGQNKVQGMHG